MQSALTRYRALAYATGVFLLLLTAHVIVQLVQSRTQNISYGAAKGLGEYLPGGQTWIPVVHGYLYLLYVIIAVDLWFRTRLPISRTILVLLAGTIPFMSFVAERWVRGRVTPMIEAERAEGDVGSMAPRQ
jgi:integral membrane protein